LFQCILCGVFHYEGTNVLHEAMAEKLSGPRISSQKVWEPQKPSHILGAGCENLGTRSRSFYKLKISWLWVKLEKCQK